MDTIYNYVRQTPTNIVEEHYEDVGSTFTLGTFKRAFLGSTFQLRRVSAGPLLVRDTDYELVEQDVFYSQPTYEDEPVYTRINILNAVYELGDLYVTYDAVLTYATFEAVLLSVRPVGSQYIQVASVADNTEATAFPTDERPAALFGGTWSEIWDDEGIFLSTEGGGADQTFYDNNVLQAARTLGLQADYVQQHYGRWYSTFGLFQTNVTNEGQCRVSGSGQRWSGAKSSVNSTEVGVDSRYSPDARISPYDTGQTRVRNRLMKIWMRDE